MFYLILGSILLLIVVIVVILYRRGIAKIKPKPIPGLPCPPFSHSLLGHPDKMVHPLRHELRLHTGDSINYSAYQLLMMKHVSVFVNESIEAANAINNFQNKGPIYIGFRFDQNIPDLYASDNEVWKKRSELLTPAIESLTKNNVPSHLLVQLQACLESFKKSKKTLNLVQLTTLLSLDVVCYAVFGYELNAILEYDNEDSEGHRIYSGLSTLAAMQLGEGLYKIENARKVSPEELAEAKASWRAFLEHVIVHLRKNRTGRPFVEALLKLEARESLTHQHILGEVHQILRHGHECLGGQLCWTLVALHRNISVRNKLEKELDKCSTNERDGVTGEYLQAVIKESLRRFPVNGNMIVRTATEPDMKLSGTDITLPVGTPLHLHIWSMHNSLASWGPTCRDFQPNRWMSESKCPQWPFFFEGNEGNPESEEEVEDILFPYNGAGFDEGSICFMPFSAGPRICPGRSLALDSLRHIIAVIVKTYRLVPKEEYYDVEPGRSAGSTIMPALEKSVAVVVKKRGEKDASGGWAEEEEEEEEEDNEAEPEAEEED